MSTPFQGMYPDPRKIQEQILKMFGNNGFANGFMNGAGMPGQEGGSQSAQQNGWPFGGMNGNWTDWLSQMGVPFHQNGESSSVPIDIYESGEHVIVVAEIPGIDDARDVHLSVSSDQLEIRGQVERSYGQTGGTLHVSERHIGQFERVVNLPVRVKRTGVRAKYKNGLLTISLVKSGRSGAGEQSSVSVDFL